MHEGRDAHLVHDGPTSSPIEWLILLPLLLILAVYLVGSSRHGRGGTVWPGWRSVAFVTGMVIAAWAISPPVSPLAHVDLRAHMAQHLLLGMVAPIGLALGAPMTLVLRSVPTVAGRRIAAILRSRPLHLLSHPITALTLNIGGMYLLYLTPIFAASMRHPALHLVVNVHFLAAGYLFVWSIAGPDPAPRRPGFGMRLGVLVLSLGLHANLAKLMYAHGWPRGTSFSVAEVQEAAMVMYYGGDIAELLLAVVLFASWYQQRKRQRHRSGQRVAGPSMARAHPH